MVNAAVGLYVKETEEGVEDVVLRVFAAAGAVVQAIAVNRPALPPGVRKPQHHRHPRLFDRGDTVGRAVQVDAVFAQ